MNRLHTLFLGVFAVALFALAPPAAAVVSEAKPTPALNVLAVETFLADMARNVAGDQLTVDALISSEVDPHGFEPTPGDVRRVAESQVLIVNGTGLEEFLQRLLMNAGGKRFVISASDGLAGRKAGEGIKSGEHHESHQHEKGEAEHKGEEGHHHGEVDPHFWLDPNFAVHYVENIRDGLSHVDPGRAAVYAANASAYIARLRDLDRWIREETAKVPEERRILVTNHESLGYFAERYGFRVVGTVIPGLSDTASPSAKQLAHLVQVIRKTGAPAIFLETGSNPVLAEQVARETGAIVVTDLYTHSTTPPGGPAPSYIEMMKHDTRRIVEALIAPAEQKKP